jgi:hypothetical protein
LKFIVSLAKAGARFWNDSPDIPMQKARLITMTRSGTDRVYRRPSIRSEIGELRREPVVSPMPRRGIRNRMPAVEVSAQIT